MLYKYTDEVTVGSSSIGKYIEEVNVSQDPLS